MNILRDFLNNRKQRLVLNGQVSAWTNANAGVPQGPISCPLLFLVWGKVFKNAPSKTCGRQPLRNLKWYSPPQQTKSLTIFKGRLPQILLGSFLNTLPNLYQWFIRHLSSDIKLFAHDTSLFSTIYHINVSAEELNKDLKELFNVKVNEPRYNGCGVTPHFPKTKK